MTIQIRQPPAVARSRRATIDEEDDAIYAVKKPSSTRRYQPWPGADVARSGEITVSGPSALRGSAVPDSGDGEGTQPTIFIQRRRASLQLKPEHGTTSKAVAPTRIRSRRSARAWPLRVLLLGMLLAALLGLGLTALGSWWQLHQEDLQYGRPRTWQMDAVVGHHDSPSHPTHLVFINLNRHVEIIEFPGGDGTRARVYSGPLLLGADSDLTPITAEVRDVNGDGLPDLIVHIGDQRLILLNDGSGFRMPVASDHLSL